MPSRDDLAARLSSALGGEVTDVVRLSGGASRETFAFELDGRPLILQRVRSGPVAGSFSMEGEARLLGAALEAGVRVPEVVAASDDVSRIGSPYVVMARLDGEAIPRRILRDDAFSAARRLLVPQCADALARIHTIAPSDAPSLAAQPQLESLLGLYDTLAPSMGAHPAFELAFRWLALGHPATEGATVVHGDFRLGNLLVGADGLTAVLDWELAHLGDPLEDLAWFSIRAWRFGAPGEVAGLASIDELVECYERARDDIGTPLEVDRDALVWWQVLETVRWGVICMLQAHTHLSGASRSVELATIGRRVCETEYDVLRLLRDRVAA